MEAEPGSVLPRYGLSREPARESNWILPQRCQRNPSRSH